MRFMRAIMSTRAEVRRVVMMTTAPVLRSSASCIINTRSKRSVSLKVHRASSSKSTGRPMRLEYSMGRSPTRGMRTGLS